jgi:hypothetical protein
MRARLVVAGVFVGSIAMLALAFDVWAASKPPVLRARILTVHLPPGAAGRPIGGLALDGTEAAFAKAVPSTDCTEQRVYRWNLATGGTSRVSGAKTCALASSTSTGAGIFTIGLAGSHNAAWLYNYGGNSISGERLFSTTAKPGKDTVLATAYRRYFKGSWIGGLVSDADGSRLTYATWSTGATGSNSATSAKSARGPRGPNGPIGPTSATGVVTESALWRISGSTTYRIAKGSGAVIAASGDAGRIALLRSDGSAAIYGTAGNFVRKIVGADFPCIPGQPGPARCAGEAIALTGNLVAVLADPNPWGQAGSIKVYDRTSGKLLHTWPNITAWTFDAYAGIAIYGTDFDLHAIDLRTGKNTVVAETSYTIGGARFDKAGLLYYFNGPWSETNGQNGQLVFVPFKTIAAKLGR